MAEPVTVPLSAGQRNRFTALARQQRALQDRMNELAECIVLGQFTDAQIDGQPLSLTPEGIVFTPNEVA